MIQPSRVRQPGLPPAIPGLDELPPGWVTRVTQAVRAVLRGLVAVLWTGPACLVQAVLIRLPGRAKAVFPRVYWALLCRVMGLRVRIVGTPATGAGRPVVFACNHSSWLDILVLGALLEGRFVAKEEVGRWPLVGTVARLGRTVFVSRRAAGTARERDSMRDLLAAGENLVLFPEGTSSDGARVLPFRSSFFSVAVGGEAPLVQPVSLVYDRLAGLPMGRASRPVSAWYGDMELGSHFWRLAQYRGLHAVLLLHLPVEPAQFASRKALAQAVWGTVAAGAATLRQNRPAVPLASGVGVQVPA